MPEQLGDDPIRRFLDGREVAVLATVRADGRPMVTPMWFLHDPEGLIMISLADTQKVRNLRRDPRVSVVAEAGARADIRGVAVHGRAELLSDSDARRALTERFLARYHPDLERRWGGRTLPPDRVMFRIVPDAVRSWGL